MLYKRISEDLVANTKKNEGLFSTDLYNYRGFGLLSYNADAWKMLLPSTSNAFCVPLVRGENTSKFVHNKSN